MKVLWLRPDKPENVSVGRHRLAGILRDRGHEVTVRNATVGDAPSLLREPADVVVGTTRLGALIGAVRRLLAGTPLVVDHIDPIAQFRRTHGRVMTALVSRLETTSFRVADHVMVVYAEECERVARYNAAVTETRLGVEVDRFADPDAEIVDRAREAVAEAVGPDARTVVYVGGLEPAYNVRTLVDAMDHLAAWDLLVLGDGSQREVVESAGENVHYLGTVPHEAVPGYMHVADVGVSLVDDPNTLKVLEYGAAGLPVVSLAGDPEARFGEAVTYCSREPEDVARAVRTAAAAGSDDALFEIARRHSWASIADEYEAALESATEPRGA